MKIVLSSRNKNKIREMETLLSDNSSNSLEILSLDDIGFFDEIIEDGNTFEENALIKAKAAAKSGYIAIADDSGLMVDALKGEPGVYSARYAGEHSTDEENNAKLLNELKDIPMQNRTARFVSCIVCVFPERENYISVRGECEGIILNEPRGRGGFGYDPLFYFPEFDKTFAELTPEEKNSVSHRGIAMRKFAKAFLKELKDE